MASPVRLRFVTDPGPEGARVGGPASASAIRVDYAPDAFPLSGPPPSLVEQFPQVRFEPLARAWSGVMGPADLVIAAADAGDPDTVDRICANLRDSGRADRVIVFLDHPNVESTRRLVRAGAADVLAAPITEPALAVSLERLLARLETHAGGDDGRSSHVVGLLKAGGGVGATALAAQISTLLADGGRRVCLVDLDVQSGAAAMYLDLQDAVSLDDVLAAGKGIGDVAVSTALATHSSGAKVLAAPRHALPLDSVSPDAVEALLTALRREFDVILLDLPPVWTDWTQRALRHVDQIVLVTQLSVPHAHLTRRQMQMLRVQDLAHVPLTLVCNRTGGDAPSGVSVKSVERAIARPFDAVVPEDSRLMGEAINQGVALRVLRRGSKLEKALVDLAGRISPGDVRVARTGRWGR